MCDQAGAGVTRAGLGGSWSVGRRPTRRTLTGKLEHSTSTRGYKNIILDLTFNTHYCAVD